MCVLLILNPELQPKYKFWFISMATVLGESFAISTYNGPDQQRAGIVRLLLWQAWHG